MKGDISEDRRKAVHLAMTLFALLLRWLDLWAAAACAGAAILLNWVIMPLLGTDRSLLRDGERFVSGVKLYPVGVLLIILLFPRPVAAAGWAALGVVDWASNVIGRRLGRRKLPWNAAKSWAGSAAFVLVGFPAIAFLLWFAWPNGYTSPADPLRIAAAAAAAAVAGALVETVPFHWADDNITVPLVASLAAFVTLAGL